jgi:hypothetical protein
MIGLDKLARLPRQQRLRKAERILAAAERGLAVEGRAGAEQRAGDRAIRGSASLRPRRCAPWLLRTPPIPCAGEKTASMPFFRLSVCASRKLQGMVTADILSA